MMVPLVEIAVIWFAAVLIPGPDVLAIARASAVRGPSHALATVAGVALGTVTWGALGFFGIATLFAAAPWLYLAVKIAGAAYLCSVGILMLRAAGSTPTPQSVTCDSPSPSGLSAFVNGLIVNLSNPKTAVFVASIFGTVLPAEPGWSLGLGVIATTAALSVSWYLTVAFVLSTAYAQAVAAKARRLIMACAGVLFVGFGLHFACRG